ncbi:TRAP transporter small permease [Tranquillimonas alkanivorans]|uniref:TRAP transporter small permease protein n=1 Tax=Tranquillimonas alkanivorans TaxID=441119 RepID=A0A1I5VI06_9RHOB|nr:TRAP transporter small permease [Tranquillimonas alkanivorans]SFQ07083.1 TRAP-type C4-dicarboxylate transport system, small permease component [Tranquillimonas alkanivorans]
MAKLERAIWSAVDILLFAAVVGMTCLIALQVGSRLAGDSISWTEELSRFLFIWTVWLGMAAGFRRGHHPSLSILSVFLPRPVQVILRFLTPLCAALFFGLVGWFGFELLQQQLRFGEISPILQVGMWVATVPIVVGSVLAVLGAFIHAAETDRYAPLHGKVEA